LNSAGRISRRGDSPPGRPGGNRVLWFKLKGRKGKNALTRLERRKVISESELLIAKGKRFFPNASAAGKKKSLSIPGKGKRGSKTRLDRET